MSFLSTSFIDQRAAIKAEQTTISPLAGEILSSISYIEIDSVSGEVHEFKSLITDNPVEDGSVVNDHQTLLPLNITMQGMFSDTPISKNNPLTSLLESYEGRARDQFEKLKKIRDDQLMFTLITGVKAYSNLLFEELSIQRSAGKGQRVDFSAKIKQIIIVNPDTGVADKKVAFDVEHSAFGLISLGTVST